MTGLFFFFFKAVPGNTSLNRLCRCVRNGYRRKFGILWKPGGVESVWGRVGAGGGGEAGKGSGGAR